MFAWIKRLLGSTRSASGPAVLEIRTAASVPGDTHTRYCRVFSWYNYSNGDELAREFFEKAKKNSPALRLPCDAVICLAREHADCNAFVIIAADFHFSVLGHGEDLHQEVSRFVKASGCPQQQESSFPRLFPVVDGDFPWHLSARGISLLDSVYVPQHRPSPPADLERIVNEQDDSVLLLVPAGRFLAGKEKFAVELPALYLGIHAVTNAQYKRFVDATGYPPPKTDENVFPFMPSIWHGAEFSAEMADHPVVYVNWQDATAYCEWAGLCLPRELEWEKAARGTDGRRYPWGDADIAKVNSIRSEMGKCDVSSYPRGPWGHYLTAGNLWEWCEDWFDEEAYGRYRRGHLSLPSSGDERVIRGGSYGDGLSCAECAYRYGLDPRRREINVGFRVARHSAS
jgi:formylglycine-generating enzyme required for sulfatase activity